MDVKMHRVFLSSFKFPLALQCMCWTQMTACVWCSVSSCPQWCGLLLLISHECHICAPVRRQAITWINADLLSIITPLGRSLSEIQIEIQNFSFMKIHLKMLFAKCRPFCPGGDELTSLSHGNAMASQNLVNIGSGLQVMAWCYQHHYPNQPWVLSVRFCRIT